MTEPNEQIMSTGDKMYLKYIYSQHRLPTKFIPKQKYPTRPIFVVKIVKCREVQNRRTLQRNRGRSPATVHRAKVKLILI